MTQLLSNICDYINEKIAVNELSDKNYISTENMLPNKSGIVKASTLPNMQLTPAYQENDVLISNIRPYFKKIWQAEYCGGCSNDVLVLRAKQFVNPKFLYYVLSEDKFFDYATATSKGTKMPRGDKSAIMKYGVPEFSEIEQEKIANILFPIDKKIAINSATNNNLEQQAQALFYEIYNNGKCGTIGDILEIIETGSRPKGGALTHGVPSIGAENINGFGVYDYSKDKFISAEFYNKLNRGIVKSKDVLLYKDGAYTGKVSMTLDDFPHKQCAVNEHVFLLRTNKLATQFFLYFCLLDNSNRQKIHTLACGKAAQPGLNQNELKSVPIKIPNIEDIINFDITVTPIMKQIANNAKEKQKLAQLRDTLLPKLMSGEIDVSKVDISADKLLFSILVFEHFYIKIVILIGITINTMTIFTSNIIKFKLKKSFTFDN